uniref:Acyltransferase 3 domain-containing protein n=1 Tax=Biomphalaria glabrata TaxID=6526 RepID=A0A2C9LX36_BIOGL
MPNDMQFYAIAPLFTIPIVYGFVRLGLLTAGLMVACHFVSTIYTIYHGDFLTREDARENYLTHIYIKPWTRIGPYAIGLVLGFLMTVLNSDFKMSKKALFTGWLLTSAFVVPMFFFQDGGHTREHAISMKFYGLNVEQWLSVNCADLEHKSRSQLSEWCEELGQSLLLRHPKNRPPDANKGPPQPGLNNMHPQMHKAMQPMHP